MKIQLHKPLTRGDKNFSFWIMGNPIRLSKKIILNEEAQFLFDRVDFINRRSESIGYINFTIGMKDKIIEQVTQRVLDRIVLFHRFCSNIKSMDLRCIL